jgi:hypothetical protein
MEAPRELRDPAESLCTLSLPGQAPPTISQYFEELSVAVNTRSLIPVNSSAPRAALCGISALPHGGQDGDLLSGSGERGE